MFHKIVDFFPTWFWAISFSILLMGHSYRLITRLDEPGGKNRFQNSGFVDFHNAIYYPVRCFLDGKNPYGRQYIVEHPDGKEFPLFPPHTLLFHLPFALSSIAIGRISYFVFQIFAFGAFIAWLVFELRFQTRVKHFLMIGTLVMLTIPFYNQFYFGQLTFQIVLAAWATLYFSKSRPMIAGLALAVVAIKPQFAIPISLMLLCRKEWKPVVIGAAVSIALSAVTLAFILNNVGWESFFSDLKTNYFSSVATHPALGTAGENYRRIDIYPTFARFLGDALPLWVKAFVTSACLTIGGAAVFVLSRKPQVPENAFVSKLIIFLVTLACVYHSIYDGLILLLPLFQLTIQPPPSELKLPRFYQWTLTSILLFLSLNIFTQAKPLRLLGLEDATFGWNLATSLGGIATFIALLICAFYAFTKRTEIPS